MIVLSRRALLASCALVACGGARARTANAPHATLADLEARYEALMAEHGLAEWHEYTNEGAPPAGGLDRIQADERALFQQAKPLADAAFAAATTPLERRAAQLWRDGALGLELVGDPEVSRLTHEMERRLDAHAFMNGTQRLTRADVRRLAMSANADDRRTARELDAGAHREVADIARALFRRRAVVARALGVPSWGDAMLRLRGIEPAAWDTFATSLERGSRDAYQRLLASAAQRTGLSRITPADAQYALGIDTEWTADRLHADDALPFARRALAALGFDLDHPPVRVVVREFSFGGQTLAIHVPDDVRTVLRPQAGQRFYGTLMHELGHALQGTRTRATRAVFKAYEWVPGLSSPGFEEGMAETFGTLFSDATFLTRFTPFTDEERTRLLDALRTNELGHVRALLASVAFERTALSDPEQDLDALQRRLDHDVRGLDAPSDTPPTWAATPFLATYAMYTQSYVLAAATAAQVHAGLRARFGDPWFGAPAAQHITTTLFAPGESVPWNERITAATGRPLAPDDLLARLAPAAT